jgi:hypothetical protein
MLKTYKGEWFQNIPHNSYDFVIVLKAMDSFWAYFSATFPKLNNIKLKLIDFYGECIVSTQIHIHTYKKLPEKSKFSDTPFCSSKAT